MTRRIIGLDPTHPLVENSTARLHGQRRRVRYARYVLWTKLGGVGAPCHWCGRDLVWRPNKGGADTLNADHLDGDYRNDAPANIVPSCKGCNGNRNRRIDDQETCSHGHLWSENLYVTPSGWRGCRACSRERTREWKARSA